MGRLGHGLVEITETKLLKALSALVNITVQWEMTPDDDDAEGWCSIADRKRSEAQTALAEIGFGIDWNAVGSGETSPIRLLSRLGSV